jgi:hypothetical protein
MKLIRLGPELTPAYEDAPSKPVRTIIAESIPTLDEAKTMQGALIQRNLNNNITYLLEYENSQEVIAQYCTQIVATHENVNKDLLIKQLVEFSHDIAKFPPQD